jgi:hypothetical protein
MEISLRNEEMNDHVSLLLQGYAAKRQLAELFQLKGFVQENQPPIAIVAHELIPAVQTGINNGDRLAIDSLKPTGCELLRRCADWIASLNFQDVGGHCEGSRRKCFADSHRPSTLEQKRQT